jgi:hypothetical protein
MLISPIEAMTQLNNWRMQNTITICSLPCSVCVVQALTLRRFANDNDDDDECSSINRHTTSSLCCVMKNTMMT